MGLNRENYSDAAEGSEGRALRAALWCEETAVPLVPPPTTLRASRRKESVCARAASCMFLPYAPTPSQASMCFKLSTDEQAHTGVAHDGPGVLDPPGRRQRQLAAAALPRAMQTAPPPSKCFLLCQPASPPCFILLKPASTPTFSYQVIASSKTKAD